MERGKSAMAAKASHLVPAEEGFRESSRDTVSMKKREAAASRTFKDFPKERQKAVPEDLRAKTFFKHLLPRKFMCDGYT